MSEMGKNLIEAMQEVLDHAQGKIELRTTRLPVTPIPETMSADEIKETRQNLGMSQGLFALTIGVSKKTVESWEAGRYVPDGAARRLISILQADPLFPEKYGIISKQAQA
jgi:putative transcriptional regulator